MFVLCWCESPLVVLACESLHVCAVCIWPCEPTKFYVELFTRYINNFIHSFVIGEPTGVIVEPTGVIDEPTGVIEEPMVIGGL